MRITKNPGDYGCRKNPDPMSGIYMTLVMEYQCRIVAKNRRKKYKVKHNSVHVNAVKRTVHITKQGRSFEKILYTVANLQSDTNTT